MDVKEITGKLTGFEGEKRIVVKLNTGDKTMTLSTFDTNIIPKLKNLMNELVDVEYIDNVKGEITYHNIQDIRKHEVSEFDTKVEIQKEEAVEKYDIDLRKMNQDRELKIVKQSCLKCAVEFHKGEAGLTPAKVIETTKVFVKYVMNDE